MSSSPAAPSRETNSASRIPLGVITLGIVSFLTDVSSEAIFAILPIYFVSVLGGSTLLLGMMEGMADFASSSLNLASGVATDRTGKGKWIAFSGYALSTTAKSLLLMVFSAAGVVAFRVIERFGKSIRGVPRDALLSAISPPDKRGLSFGIHKALDKAGAVLGPLLAYLVLAQFGTTAGTFRGLFMAALVPAVIAVAILGFLVKDRPVKIPPRRSIRETLAVLGPRYRRYLAASMVFSLGYFSFAFLMLKAKSVGFETQDQALLYGLFNLVFTLVSIPVGWLGDRVGRRTIVMASYVIYAGLSAGFLLADSRTAVVVMFVVYGVFYAMDEGQAKAYVADLSTEETRATALGIYGFVTGMVYLLASLIAGWLWSYAPAWAFGFAIATSIVALAVFAFTSESPAHSASDSQETA